MDSIEYAITRFSQKIERWESIERTPEERLLIIVGLLETIDASELNMARLLKKGKQISQNDS